MGRSAEERRAELVNLYRELHDDHGCPLAAARTHIVFGMGNADADLMFVGEAPGRNEDLQGKPFVGQAGQLLDTLLGEIGLTRKQVFIANVLMCRPPGNRDPLPEEIEECKPYLLRKIELIEPKVICTLGNFATKTLSGRPEGITKVCGRAQERTIAGLDVKLYPLFHPAAALRTPSVLERLRADFSCIPQLLEEERETPRADGEGFPARGDFRGSERGGNHSPEATTAPEATPPEATTAGRAEPSQLGLFG